MIKGDIGNKPAPLYVINMENVVLDEWKRTFTGKIKVDKWNMVNIKNINNMFFDDVDIELVTFEDKKLYLLEKLEEIVMFSAYYYFESFKEARDYLEFNRGTYLDVNNSNLIGMHPFSDHF